MKRILALDVGDVRIGIAVSDILGIIANPLETHLRLGDSKKDATYIKSICDERDVGLIVCGLPKSLDGSDSLQTIKVRQFAEVLKDVCNLEVKFVDERLTTVSAERVLIEGNVRREDRKKFVDKVAATIILQTYLGC